MKKCPTCQKTFDDNMRFCQTDGTPLVEIAEPPDPYATMVASKDEIAASIPSERVTGADSSKQDDLLEVPAAAEDPMKTSVVTEAEMREMAIGGDSQKKSEPAPFDADATFVLDSKPSLSDISDISDSPSELPKFDEPNLNPPSFSDSPYSSSKPETQAQDNPFSSPIPSPFGEKMPPSYQTPSNSPFQDPEPPKFEPSSPFGQSPFDHSEPANRQIEQTDWTPPAGNFGESASAPNPPAPAATEAGQSKTLAIVSLVLGILSIPCCSFIIVGIAAVITGFLAKSKADSDPNQYGGRTLALVGIALGAITTIIAIIANLLVLFGVLPMPTFPS
jgi:hypothetical protein